MRQRKPEQLVEDAVHGMLPKTKLGEAMYRKLKVYAGPDHPHAAQKPTEARGRVTWQQFSTTEPAVARPPPPASFFGPAAGAISVNQRDVRSVLPHRGAAHADPPAAVLTETADKFDILATVAGGGVSGRRARCGSASHARSSSTTRSCASALKKAGLLTRDARAKERKKYGMAGARKRFQFSKR